MKIQVFLTHANIHAIWRSNDKHALRLRAVYPLKVEDWDWSDHVAPPWSIEL